MKTFNIELVLDWAKGQADLKGEKSTIVEKALEEMVALKEYIKSGDLNKDHLAKMQANLFSQPDFRLNLSGQTGAAHQGLMNQVYPQFCMMRKV